MKVSLSIGVSLFAYHAYAASPNHMRADVSPPIYILQTTQPAANAIGKALDTLGYSRQDPRPDPSMQRASFNTYVEVSGAQFANISRSHAGAKFILPRVSPQLMAEEDLASLASILAAEDRVSEGFLELDALAVEQAVQAENWVSLCSFLGMGYSTVERLGLWHFPK
ncbi:hypothetical protein M426DRAFT_21247 [Hypoxylon sp. CI-4A]|nr:hypothetical protein M426DRAFT_21247 [Hypoxylon sp. CI-4A]